MAAGAGPAGLWLLLKPPKGSALPCDGEMALGGLAQLRGCQLERMSTKSTPLGVHCGEGGGQEMDVLTELQPRGLEKQQEQEKPGEEVIHMFNSPSIAIISFS